MAKKYTGFFDRETMMKQWDSWHKYIAEGGKGSWPRDAFEALLDYFEERLKQCPECQQNKESGMNFCANCGRQLWDKEIK